MKRIEYQEPVRMSRGQLVAALGSSDKDIVAQAMVSAALFEPDWAWAEEHFVRFGRDPDAEIRGLAAICLGHLARIHGRIHLEVVIPLLRDLSQDPATCGPASDALDDIAMFVSER